MAETISQPETGRSPLAVLIAFWGVLGVLALLGQAVWKLTPIALEPIVEGTLTGAQWAIYLVWIAINVWGEGIRGFHQKFSPRVVARAFYLSDNPRLLHVLLAPLFCMSFFYATRRGKIVAWGILAMVVVLVVLVRMAPQPWRGIIDGGVVIALALGSLSIVYFFARALAGTAPPVGPDLPGSSDA